MIHGAVTFEIFVMLRIVMIVMIKIHVSHLLLRHTRSIKKADNVMHRDRLVMMIKIIITITMIDPLVMRQLSPKALLKKQGKP